MSLLATFNKDLLLTSTRKVKVYCKAGNHPAQAARAIASNKIQKKNFKKKQICTAGLP